MKAVSRDRRKYLIIEALRELDVEVDRHIQLALPVELGITPKTFRTWCNLGKADRTDIPGQKLVYIARRLGKSVEELCTEIPPVKNVTKELKDPTNIIQKFGLSR